MSDLERKQLLWVLDSLRDFRAGHLLAAALTTPGVVTPVNGFLSDALIQRLHAYYLGSHMPVLSILLSLRCDDLAEPLREILARRVGEQSVSQVLETYRNKLLAHPSFNFNTVLRHFEALNIDTDSLNARTFWGAVRELFDRTSRLFDQLGERYPESLGGPFRLG